MALFNLPAEILRRIYCNLSDIHEAINFAQTCRAANNVLCLPLSTRYIFQSIVSSNNRKTQQEPGMEVLNKLYGSVFPVNQLEEEEFHTASLHEFLMQFGGITSFSLIDTVIMQSAKYQMSLMEGVDSSAIGPRTLIAWTLHSFVISSIIAKEMRQKSDDEGDIDQYCSRLLEHPRSGLLRDVKPFGAILQAIYKTVERLIRQGTAEDWPTILTVLCLLYWISSEFGREDHNIQVLYDISGELEAPLSRLCRLFYIQMGGDHPLSDSWCPAKYSTRVQGDSLAMDQFLIFNRRWRISTCVESYELELDLDRKGHQRVDSINSFENELPTGMAGWIDRMECFCWGPDYVFQRYPPFSSTLSLWELKPVDPDCWQ
ncbi:hypothetical protein BBP40_004740 [Aspergillus hancockii]|nr:hypothetical protein BBP40_004740 [Aspergillus hancockii]